MFVDRVKRNKELSIFHLWNLKKGKRIRMISQHRMAIENDKQEEVKIDSLVEEDQNQGNFNPEYDFMDGDQESDFPVSASEDSDSEIGEIY
jgi:hypothetical protein